MLQSVLLDLFLEATLLQQLVCLIQNKQSDAGGGQHAQLDKLLDTTCERNQERGYNTQITEKSDKPLFIFHWGLTR